VIKARGLARRFASRQGVVDAVRGVDLDVAPGELVGFLGPNGAGKTTTLRMLATLLRPTEGEAVVAGHNLRTDPVGVRRRIGYVAQTGGTDAGHTVEEELVTQGRLYRMTKADCRSMAADLSARLDLDGIVGRQVHTLSGGQRRRLDIAMGLIHSPRLVFLDEPTAALDPQSRANLWEHIRCLRAEHGLTVFLTTHYLDEADALCDRVLVIDEGRIVAQGSPEELKRSVSGDTVTMTVLDRARVPEASRIAERTCGGIQLRVQDTTVVFRVGRSDAALPVLLGALHDAGVQLAAVAVQRPTLDDVFLTLTGHSLRDEEN